MLSAEQNERLTQVGPGTPAGEMLRRYWQPLAAAAELKDQSTKKVRLLGEDLALFRDRSGKLGLVAELCPHRRCSLAYGVPENEGIRCPYHGWLFDREGNCLEQPAEPAESSFRERVKTISYPVREVGGIFWTYMGPGEAPVFPRHDYLVQENTLRDIGLTMLPINWVQAMENSLDPTHLEWLHMWYGYYIQTGQSHTDLGDFPQARHAKIGFDVTDYGIVKRRFYEGGSEEDHDWRIGHPVLFPNILKVGNSLQIRVIVDDVHTLHMLYNTYCYDGVQAPHQDVVPAYQIPYLREDGTYDVRAVLQQDMMAWVTQGAIADRTVEHLGVSDKGIILYRQVFEQQVRRVEAGEEPMFVYRDPDHSDVIEIPIDTVESAKVGVSRRSGPGEGQQRGQLSWMNDTDPKEMLAKLESVSNQSRWSPINEQIVQMRMEYLKARGAA
jgi:5,5'-dehydrodivanillate O-demethylase oxygenase subunit